MKLSRIVLARLIGLIERNHALNLSNYSIEEIDNICDFEMPPPEPIDCTKLNSLLSLMQKGNQKIEAIKAYRALTGMGLKESKDAVEEYWQSPPFGAKDFKKLLLDKIEQQISDNYDHRTNYTLAQFNHKELEKFIEFIHSFATER